MFFLCHPIDTDTATDRSPAQLGRWNHTTSTLWIASNRQSIVSRGRFAHFLEGHDGQLDGVVPRGGPVSRLRMAQDHAGQETDDGGSRT